jgi:hypothetical protein
MIVRYLDYLVALARERLHRRILMRGSNGW